MKEKIDAQYFIVELAKQSMISCNIEPRIIPVRGGTDGSRLSYMGLPCPNIFGGGHNFHGIYEYIPTKSMESACRVIVEIAGRVAALQK
jgi:tripeptide aminopeptidase